MKATAKKVQEKVQVKLQEKPMAGKALASKAKAVQAKEEVPEKDAEWALGQDNSESNYLRLVDVKARLARMEGTEALIEGFGASSGRSVRSL